MANTDNLLDLVRRELEKAAKGDLQAAKNAHGAFGRLDKALREGGLIPEDWDPGDDGDDDGELEESDDDGAGDDEGELDELDDDAAVDEMRRVLGGEA